MYRFFAPDRRTPLGALATFAAASVVAAVAPAAHAVISYGELEGADFNYFGVLEASITDDVPLYGEPDIGGNTLFFTPVTFGAFASASNGGVDLTDGALAFRLESDDNATAIETLEVVEQGDYSIVGQSGAVSASIALVGLITEIDGVDIDPIAFSASEMIFDADDLGGGVWDGVLAFDLAGFLVDEGIEGGATEVAVVIDNTLFAAAGEFSASLINKKSFEVSPNGSNIIPEPSTALLSFMGLSLLVSARRVRVKA